MIHHVGFDHIVKYDGLECHIVNGKRHRLGAPAVITPQLQEWLVEGLYHRDDGPARVWPLLLKCEWWLDGKHVMSADFTNPAECNQAAFQDFIYKDK